MSWGTVGSMWPGPTLEGVYEQAIRYGTVLGCGADGIVRNAAAPFTSSKAHPSGDI